MKRLALLFSFCLSSYCWAEPLVIKTRDGPVTLDVELAKDLRQGLMFRTQMDPLSGMLFVYEKPHVVSMWMKNTLIPLDMIFVDEQGKIIYIHENAVPKSLKPISANQPTKAVIEINGGQAKKLGLEVGDLVLMSGIIGIQK